MSEARRIIRVRERLLDEAVWLEALRLHPPEEAREIAGRGLRRLPKSVKLWLATAELEVVGVAATRDTVLAKVCARQRKPGKWCCAVRLNFQTQSSYGSAQYLLRMRTRTRIMLSRAVEWCPAQCACGLH